MRRRAIREGSWANKIQRNLYNLNSFCLDWLSFEGCYEMPILGRSLTVPDKLFPFDERNKYQGDGAIHFYCEDTEFESVWLRANRHPHMPAVIQKAGVTLTPDFSLYTDYPLPTQIWNVYRSRLLGALWQHLGIDVIPSVSWADKRSFDFCFDGLPVGGTVAIASSYWHKSESSLFFDGFKELLARCEPSTVLVYGRSFEGVIEALHPNVRRYDSRLTEIYYEQTGKKRREKPKQLAIAL